MCNTNNLLYKEECYQIQGAIFDVNKEIGTGFLESIYQECLERELTLRNIPHKRQVSLSFNYKQQPLDQYFIADLICYDTIIIEVKSVKAIEPAHRAQLLNYLKITNLRLGLLVNFNAYPKATIERIVL
jgi:GxxExxY protein